MCAQRALGYDRAMLLRPLRRAPMMLGGVGFQAGLDDSRRKQIEAQRRASAQASAADAIKQIEDLKALHDGGALSAEEFQMAKRKLLEG
jgi:hypothetical protein